VADTFAVVTPSRGLIHSRTVEAVLGNIAGRKGFRGWFVTHDLPIPDCDEQVTELGLASGADVLWFVEEDVIPPPGALAASFAMLAEGHDVAAVDYPVGALDAAWGCLVRDKAKHILWAGLGATLIRRRVFEKTPRPWFTTDWRYQLDGGTWVAERADGDPAARFGQQDIHFFMSARAAGFRIGQVPGMIAGHALLREPGALGSNHGTHAIDIRTRITTPYPGPAPAPLPALPPIYARDWTTIAAVIPTRYHPLELAELLRVLAADRIRVYLMESERFGHRIHAMWNAGVQMARAAGATEIAILNDDVALLPGSLPALRDALRTRPNAGIAYPDERAPWGVLAPSGTVEETTGSWGAGGMTGFAFMFKAELGIPFDEGFGWWYGDDAFEEAVRARGLRTCRVLGVPVRHTPNGSSGKRWSELAPVIDADRKRWEAMHA
jgi:hypothetical protein